MNKLKTVPIVFSCDDNYIPFLAVALESLEENASKNYKYDIKILHTNTISEENQKKILNKYNKGVFNIVFDDINSMVESIAEKLHTRDYYSKSTYYRLFIPNLYKQYNKVLYLDSDIVVKGDISEMYNIDIGSNLIGATTDEFVYKTPIFHKYFLNKVNVKRIKDYFNAGIIIMNCKKMREVDFEGKFIDTISKIKFTVAQDQDYLNAICRGKVKYISGVWDKMAFEDEKIKEKDVKIFHFNLDRKPWQKDGVLYEDHFWKYAKLTEYYNDILNIKNSWTPERIEMAAKQTENLVKLAIDEGNDIVQNAIISKIIDAIWDEKEPLSVKYEVKTVAIDEDVNDVIEVVSLTKKLN